ncbi:hypothetical protein EW026_g6790 [Hermanssonia centrifuga]|uniref:Integrase catalytic domain-containing protein n=1 Tax=Hermanssonia centrifuga TaxID=98765 RepID=A0A4S4K9X0_9APHY|nr:hypothetical protein EW026_g6790 [Hermanssonia centrifuga]
MAFLIERNKVSLYDAHIRNGHVSYEYIKKALNSDHKYLGLQIDPSKMEEPLCEACVKGKISRAPIRQERISNRAVNFGDILHMDLWRPSPVRAPGGLQYTFTILDEATGWLHEPKMRTKDEAFGQFVAWQSQCFTQNGIRIKMVHSDRGGEFLSKDFTNFLEKEGIVRRLTVHNTPEHNGMAERVHRTIFNTVRTLLAESGLPPFLWGEAHNHAVYVYNHSPQSFLQFKTPFKARHGVRPNCTFL